CGKSMEKIRVLVADDHAIMREGVCALLRTCDDIEIVGEAANGNEVIRKCRETEPHVVVMDIAMPEMDGLEATRQLKKRSKNTRVIILTQHQNREYILPAVKAGADGYVPKGAVSSELIFGIRAVYRGDSFLHPSIATAVVEDYRLQAGSSPFDSLTSREREVLKLLADGKTCREISGLLFISLKTVMGHRTRIMEKLDIHNRTELIKYAVRKGLTSVDA
ncbi:MAG: response regulator transcription factor, partial [Dehalococcoidales bacterium]|nr:response regulator transcription factor [Dehalococcoidales bacterium]